MGNNVMINLTKWYLVNKIVWKTVCCTALCNNFCNHKLLLFSSPFLLHHLQVDLGCFNLLNIGGVSKASCAAWPCFLPVISNQLLGHIHPETQQNIFISCSLSSIPLGPWVWLKFRWKYQLSFSNLFKLIVSRKPT